MLLHTIADITVKSEKRISAYICAKRPLPRFHGKDARLTRLFWAQSLFSRGASGGMCRLKLIETRIKGWRMTSINFLWDTALFYPVRDVVKAV